MRKTTTQHASGRILTLALVGVIAVAVASPAMAGTGASGSTDSDEDATPQSEQMEDRDTSAKLAMARDLGLSAEDVDRRLKQEGEATEVQEEAVKGLGDSFAGAYFDADSGSLIVAVTDEGRVSQVRASGATPRVVTHSENNLKRAQKALDDHIRPDSKIASTGIDPITNEVVVTVMEGAAAQVQRLIVDAGVEADIVRVETTTVMPQNAVGDPSKETNSGTAAIDPADFWGGDTYKTHSGSTCSVGFATTDEAGDNGFMTAGHCAQYIGEEVQDADNSRVGAFYGREYPGDRDVAFVKTENILAAPLANRYDGTTVPVRGSRVSPIGTTVCRSGTTSGWRCGEVRSFNYTANYGEGNLVSGLTRTTACTSKGDSGGPAVGGAGTDQAQGVVSGFSGGQCDEASAAGSYIQPLEPALRDFNATLITTS